MRFISILFFLTIFKALAQESITITVLDRSDNLPLFGALIVDLADWKKGGITDTLGQFKSSVFSSQDSILISFIGYKEQVIGIQQVIQNGGSIYLSPVESPLEEIEIKAERLVAEEFVWKKLDKMDIYTNPSSKADPLLAVMSMPSATTLDESASVSFRGAGPEETGIFFNQIPIYDPGRFAGLNGIGTFSVFNTSILDKVWVFPSNPPLEYGNVTSGIVALETSGKVARKSAISLLSSLANIGITNVQPIGKKASFTIYANHLYSGGLKTINNKSLEDVHEFGTNEIGALYNHKLNKNIGIRSFLYATKENFDVSMITPRYDGSFVQHKEKWISLTNVTGRVKKGDEIALNFGFIPYHTKLKYSAFNYDIFKQDIYSSLTYSRTKKRSAWKTGLSLDSRFSRFQSRIPLHEYADGIEDPSFEINTADRLSIVEGFFSWKYTPSSRFATGYAVRKNKPMNGQPNTFSFQSSLAIEPWLNHRFTWGRGIFHQLRLSEMGSLVHTRSEQTALDYSFETDKLEIQHSFYYRKVKRNEGMNAEVLGIESYIKYNPIKSTQFDLSYSRIQATDIQNKTKIKSQYDLDFFVRGSIQWQKYGWTIGGRYQFRQGIWINPIIGSSPSQDFSGFIPIHSESQDRLFPYKILDVNVSKLIPLHPRHSLVIFASVSNLFNWKNTRTRAYNRDFSEFQQVTFNQRTIYLGVNYSLH